MKKKLRRLDYAEYFGGTPMKLKIPAKSKYLTREEVVDFRRECLPTSEAEE